MNLRYLSDFAVEIEHEKQILVMEPVTGKNYSQANVITLSQGKETSETNNNLHVLSWPGEYEIKEWLFQGIETDNQSIIFSVKINNIHIVHLGQSKTVSSEDLDKIDDIDVLILPIPNDINEIKTIQNLIEKLDARIIIPVGAMMGNFIEKMGGEKKPALVKLNLQKSTLPIDKTEIIELIPIEK